MKKALVLALTVLALAGFTTVAHADLNVFLNGWIGCYPSLWMGSNQATYGTTPSNHSITYTTVAGAGVGGTQSAARFVYDKAKESWAGEVVQAGGGSTGSFDLSAYTSLSFRVRKELGGPDIKIQKIFMVDGNGTEYDAVGNTPGDPTNKMITVTDGTWGSIPIPISLPNSANLASVNQLWGFVITAADNLPASGTIAFYVDEVKYAGGGKGEVIVKITGGKRGISVAGVINFGTMNPLEEKYSQALTSGDTHFVITNLGDQRAETLVIGLQNPAGWTAMNQPNFNLLTGNQYVMEAELNSVAPPSTAVFTTNFANLVMTSVAKTCDGTYLAGDQTGVGIAQNGGTVNMWLALVAPPSTSTSAEMHIFVDVGFLP